MPNILLASGGYDNSIKLWDITQKFAYRTLKFTESQINCLQFSPDRSNIVVCGNPTIKAFDLQSSNPNPISSYDGHTSNITSIGFQDQSQWFFTSSEDKTVKIWDFRSTKPTVSIDFEDQVNSTVLHPNQAELYSVDNSGTLTITDLSTNKKRKTFVPGGNIPLQSVSINPCDDQFCAVNNSGNIFVYNSEMPINNVQGHSRYILKCLYSPNGKFLATTSADLSIRIWNTETFKMEKEFTGHKGWVWDCVFSSDSEFLVSASSDESIKIWDIKNNILSLTLRGHTKVVTSVALIDKEEESE